MPQTLFLSWRYWIKNLLLRLEEPSHLFHASFLWWLITLGCDAALQFKRFELLTQDCLPLLLEVSDFLHLVIFHQITLFWYPRSRSSRLRTLLEAMLAVVAQLAAATVVMTVPVLVLMSTSRSAFSSSCSCRPLHSSFCPWWKESNLQSQIIVTQPCCSK